MGVKPKIQGPGGGGFLPIYAFTDSMALKDHLYSPRHLILDRRQGALVSSLKDFVTQDGTKCRHVQAGKVTLACNTSLVALLTDPWRKLEW